MTELLVAVVRIYQWTLRPFIGAHCRFEPSCSHYAIEALRRHGTARGTMLSVRRVLRCNPWNPGGHDPVPNLSRSDQSRSDQSRSACRCGPKAMG